MDHWDTPVAMMDSVKDFRWIVNVPIGLPICAVGIIGNILSIIVWNRVLKKCRHTSNSAAVYLITLGVCDLGFILLFIASEVVPTISPEVKSTYAFAAFYAWFAYPAISFFFTSAVWLVVGVTVNRFLLIQFPLKGKSLCSQVRTRIGIVVILMLAFAVNVPHFFNYHAKQTDTGYKLSRTWYGASKYSKRFHFWCHCIIMSIMPWLAIATMNVLIIQRLKRQTRKFTSIRSRSKSEDHDHRMTTMLLSITFTLLVLLGFQCITQCLYKQEYRIWDEPFWVNVSKFYTLGRLALVINATINCILYCFSGRVFTNEARQLFSHTPRRLSMSFSSRTSRFSTISDFMSVKKHRASIEIELSKSDSITSVITNEQTLTGIKEECDEGSTAVPPPL